MENKELKIQVPEGYEIDKENSTFEKIVFKPVLSLPATWKEYCDRVENTPSHYVSKGQTYPSKHSGYFNEFLDSDTAEEVTAFLKLIQLRDFYNNGWKPDWSDVSTDKYVIMNAKGHIKNHCVYAVRAALAFKDANTCDSFFENFKELIEQAKPLL